MNETTASATNAKIAKHMTDTFGLPKYEMPKMEIPAEFREITDKGVAHARDACAKAKVASEEAADLFKNTYATVANAATDYNLKLIEIFRTNTRAAFDHVHELLGGRSLSSCRPRTYASNTISFPHRIRIFARSLRRWRLRLPSQLSHTCQRPSTGPLDRKCPIRRQTNSFQNNDPLSKSVRTVGGRQ